MTPGIRGWVVLFAVASTAALAGWSAGGMHAGKKWNQWTYEHIAWDGKAAKAAKEVRK